MFVCMMCVDRSSPKSTIYLLLYYKNNDYERF